METPNERRFRIFGTHEFIGSGAYGKDVSWIQWSAPFKTATHAEVQACFEGTGAADFRIERPLVTVKMISSCKTPAGPMKSRIKHGNDWIFDLDIFQGYMHRYFCWIYMWICFKDKLDGYEMISINNLRISLSDIGMRYVIWIYSVYTQEYLSRITKYRYIGI
jgi:hypothetical protein